LIRFEQNQNLATPITSDLLWQCTILQIGKTVRSTLAQECGRAPKCRI